MRVRNVLNPSPAYLFRPSQVLRRITGGPSSSLVTLPWGAEVEVDPSEAVGAGIARLGVHELSVSETMWRLADPRDLALDVGANIGYFTSLLACRTSRTIALEAHPIIAERLCRNVDRWSWDIEVERCAASAAAGTAILGEPEDHAKNSGTAGIGVSGSRTFEVPSKTLDEVIGSAAVGICKMDVEGHELAVLRGASGALTEGRIRDIFFEEHDPLPTPVSELLEIEGYRLFSLRQRIDRVILEPANAAAKHKEAPTYLATLDPVRAEERTRSFGWRCLRGS